MITNIEDYFSQGCGRCERFATADCSTQLWRKGLAELRQLCLGCGLDEVAKWGQPCYMHAGRNIAIIGALQGDFRLSFFHPALMKDPYHVLEKAGPNTTHAGMIRFAADWDVVTHEEVIVEYLKEAMGYAERGILPPKEPSELVLPDELIEALEADAELSAAFERLTPGRQRSYAIHVGSAKKAETRFARIHRCREKILAGKGALER